MKRILSICAVLLVAVTAMGQNRYGIKSGSYKTEMDMMGQAIVQTTYFDDYGAKEVTEMDMMGMQMTQLTIDGKTYPLPTPFIVLATQNPVEHTGTYPLPEAQLDRFFMQISLGYPTHEEEIDILKRNMRARPIDELEPVASAEDILALREERKKIICADAVLDYIIQIAEATRKDERISLGISPRGCIALTEAAMANALFSGRDYTLPDDVQKLAVHVLAHRLVLDRRSGIRGESRSSILTSIIREIKVPAVS